MVMTMAKLTHYDRSKRCWIVVDKDGEPLQFPQKWQAENTALQMHHNDLHKLAKATAAQYPALKSRSWKAAALVAKGMVNFWTRNDPSILAEVNGSQNRIYEVRSNQSGVGYTCTCADWQDAAAPVVVNSGRPARICKHILAMQFAKAIGRTDGRIIDEFGPTAAPAPAGGLSVDQYADGTAVSFSLKKAHSRFILKNQRSANDRAELGNWIYRN